MMDKTININIAGTLFQIDEDAYGILRDYLQAVNNRFKNVQGGLETIEDIELRIAEIFQSAKGLAGVITKENVETMIGIIGKPDAFEVNDIEEIPQASSFQSQPKRMYRNPDDSVISGVCGGLGAYLNTDPVIFRILFVVFTAFYGIGFLIYLALWISLPPANTDSRKRELYGDENYSAFNRNRGSNTPRYTMASKAGNAVNEIFRAIGRVFYLLVRIFMVIFGVVLVITGSAFLVTLIMMFVFNYPGGFSTDGFEMNLTYLPDFMNYVVSPSTTPWIIALSLVAFLIPVIAIIYWGIRMILWIKVRDGIYNLAGLVLWVMAVAALSIILFSEGVSFANTGKTSAKQTIDKAPDVLYLKSGKKVSELNVDKELMLEHDGYNVLINDTQKELYIRPCMKIKKSENNSFSLDLKKRSSGRNEIEARKKTEELLYNYRISGDTLFVDEYFTIPSGRKWSADNIGINIYLPESTIIKADTETESLFNHDYTDDYDEDDDDSFSSQDNAGRYWVITENGLEKREGILPVNK